MNETVMREPGNKPSKWILVVLFSAWAVLVYAIVITKIVKVGP
jgi:hypothetical protein